MNKVYIVLSKSNTILARIVRLYTRKKYSHTSLALDKSLDTIYSFGRRHPRLILPAGFISERRGKGYFDLFPHTPICVLEVSLTDSQLSEVKDKLVPFIHEPDRYLYDIVSLPAMAFGRAIKRKNRYVCSSFVAYILEHCLDFKTEYQLVYPEDYFHLGLKKVYEGEVQHYGKQILC